MKTKILFIRMFVLSCILFILGFTVGSCSDDDDAVLQAGGGHGEVDRFLVVITGQKGIDQDMDMLSSNSIRVGWQKRKKRVPVRMN